MSNSKTNDATRAEINRQAVFASGTFKNIWSGTYSAGARTGQSCVVKEFKTGSVYETHYFDEEMNIIRRAQTIIDKFDNAGIIGDRKILLNTPDIWTYEQTGQKALIETMIVGFEKFNSNTGWVTAAGEEWGDGMQALSHFSYHDSNRRFLLCELQGGIYRDG